MIMVGNSVAVAIVGMHNIDNIFMGMTVVRDLVLMTGHDLGQFGMTV